MASSSRIRKPRCYGSGTPLSIVSRVMSVFILRDEHIACQPFVFAVCASPLGIYAWKGLEQTSGRNFAYSVFAAVKCEFPTLGEVSAQSLVSAPSSSACAISAVVAANSPSATPDTAGGRNLIVSFISLCPLVRLLLRDKVEAEIFRSPRLE